MSALVLLAEVQSGSQVEKIAQTFGVDRSHLVAQIISFSIVCVLLYRFAYRPILKILEERRGQIAQGLANTEKIKANLAQTEEQCQELIGQASAEANKLIEEAHEAAAKVQKRETEKAIVAAEQIMVKAHEAAKRDHDRMFAELKGELGRLVVQTTAMVTGKILTVEDERRLIEEAAKQLPV
jgi:F-type H+-transporting ATPase subunit b